MLNIEKAANGWILRGRCKKTSLPITYVALSEADLVYIIQNWFEL